LTLANNPLPGTQTPIGYGVAAPSLIGPPSPLLADNIDPQTHDYVSLFEGRDVIEAQVLIALSVVRGSGAAVVDIGNRFHEIRKILPSIKSVLDSKAREALRLLITKQDIRYRGIELTVLDEGNQTVECVVKWENLRAFDGGAVRRTPIPVTSGG
jgi:hypothetical protein